jgi:SAM-dependent methyltransferase
LDKCLSSNNRSAATHDKRANSMNLPHGGLDTSDLVLGMSAPPITKRTGRRVFGLDPGGYHTSRPAYPGWVYQTLCSRCGLGRGAATFEIGPGTGTATRRLLDLGANPLIAVEPDARLARFLRRNNPDPALKVITSAFEDVDLGEGAFDLGVSATSFHWLKEDTALNKIAQLLHAGGWWAAFWNVFGDDSRPDPFHLATKELLDGPVSPSAGERGLPFGLDGKARLAALRGSGAFEVADSWMRQWSLTLNAEQTVSLYATYSNINVRPDREAVLAELGRIAREEFSDVVVRNMTTALYVARRTA